MDNLSNQPLESSKGTHQRSSQSEIIFISIATAVTIFFAQLPNILGIEIDSFPSYYARNFSFIVFLPITAFFLWRNRMAKKAFIIYAILFICSIIFMNMLPDVENADTSILSCIHMPFFMWALTGIAFIGGDVRSYGKRIDYLKFSANLVVMMALLFIAGIILSLMTIGLFEISSMSLESEYLQYIGLSGAFAIPIIASYIVVKNPQIVNNIAPVIAKIFTPLVIATLTIYLIASLIVGQTPAASRETLLVYNLLLIGVMALILFSITTDKNNQSPSSLSRQFGKWWRIMLITLSAITIVINLIALKAIAFRIIEWGATPNRIAVIGSNILILINLIMVFYKLLAKPGHIADSIAKFLPVYTLWFFIITFVVFALFSI